MLDVKVEFYSIRYDGYSNGAEDIKEGYGTGVWFG